MSTVYELLSGAITTVFGVTAPRGSQIGGDYEASPTAARTYFEEYFGFVPDYIELMATEAGRALEGYYLIREWALAENPLGPMYTELLDVHDQRIRVPEPLHRRSRQRSPPSGCEFYEAQVVEAVVSALPVAGVATWLPGADGILEGRA